MSFWNTFLLMIGVGFLFPSVCQQYANEVILYENDKLKKYLEKNI